MQALEEERRKASREAREAQTAAQTDITKLKHSLREAEQQRQEAVRQCEAEAHRNAVKLAQAGRSLKAAKSEAVEAQKQAKASVHSAPLHAASPALEAKVLTLTAGLPVHKTASPAFVQGRCT